MFVFRRSLTLRYSGFSVKMVTSKITYISAALLTIAQTLCGCVYLQNFLIFVGTAHGWLDSWLALTYPRSIGSFNYQNVLCARGCRGLDNGA